MKEEGEDWGRTVQSSNQRLKQRTTQRCQLLQKGQGPEHLKESQPNKKVNDQTKLLRGMNLFHIILRLLFYKPVTKPVPKPDPEPVTRKKQNSKNKNPESIHFVFIRFSAWECTGSDHLWAGLVTALCDGIEDQFGLIPLSIYRALFKDKKIDEKEGSREWVSKKFLKIPLWLVTLFVFIGILACAFISIILIYINHGDFLNFTLYIFVPMVSLCALQPFIMTLEVTKNLIVTQKVKVLRKLKRKDMSSQLGFMADVKTEVDTITSYLQMMEIFQKMKIRVIIEITKLDNCVPNRVVEVLNAITILNSNKDAPFISILAVDPGIIVECVEKSDLLRGMANNGYLFLNRVVTLPFSIPLMNHHTKSGHLNNIIDGKKSSTSQINEDESKSSENDQLLKVVTVKGNQDKRANQLIEEGRKELKGDECLKYITDNVIIMRRIVNSLVITIKLMAKDIDDSDSERDSSKKISTHKVSKWVIMAAQWPCSLSWILQCIEDEQQNGEDPQYKEIKLWDIYEMSLDALHANTESLKQLLELDGDPDTFCKLLKCTDFTVEDANMLRRYTVNLDHSIQRKIELLQGSCNFSRLKKKKTVTRMDLLGMSIEKVCEQINDLYKERSEAYKEKIQKHNLNGKALLYSKNEEIREALDMNLGDWVTFTEEFLRLPTPNLFF